MMADPTNDLIFWTDSYLNDIAYARVGHKDNDFFPIGYAFQGTPCNNEFHCSASPAALHRRQLQRRQYLLSARGIGDVRWHGAHQLWLWLR